MQCDICHGPATNLARTATTAWLGCPRCHTTWTADPLSCASITDLADEAVRPHMSVARGCLLAAALVTLALAIRLLLRPAIGNASPFLLFTPAVGIAALFGGMVPGVLATTLSTAFGSHFFLRLSGEPTVERWDRVLLFVLVGSVITASGTLLRRSREELAASLWREQKARAIAQAADRTKDDFLAMISHELQTPISVILGWLSMIRDGTFGPEATARALDTIDRNTRILGRLVDDVLDRSRIATGTLRLDPQLISLVTVVRAAVDQVHAKIESAGLELHLSLPSTDVPIVGDSIRLQQVVTNLLTNAVKFTPRGGSISVDLATSRSDATLIVTDTGSGISAEMLPHIFEPFRQDDETLRQSRLGLGLGLSISRYLVERHHGMIHVASAGRGRGASFSVTLPLADAVPAGEFDPVERPSATAHRYSAATAPR